ADAVVYRVSGALFGLVLWWLVGLAASFSVRGQATPEPLASLPMRSPIGGWGSVLGLALVSCASLKTWWDSRISLVSGVSYLPLLSAAYAVMKLAHSKTVQYFND